MWAGMMQMDPIGADSQGAAGAARTPAKHRRGCCWRMRSRVNYCPILSRNREGHGSASGGGCNSGGSNVIIGLKPDGKEYTPEGTALDG